MAPSRPVLDDDNQDDDILSLSDDEEQDDKADEALSGDDELGELRPIELANRLAQEVCCYQQIPSSKCGS